ncbi:two-component regulator propeller domain-containing protein [Bacteroides ovatus]|uniref:two-component regulator propeller domain-containing protein n=1 Tax=Bacteroides ovatus TaxID=28116 RepID=UPI0020A7DEF3|nr:two-component regulator propeller domain-containing protein [Bacteroides ovatus]CAG9929745.1 Periplasmic ligand-binding sensor domain COG3292 / BaeS-type histidine kinase / OmpR-type DNA-binding response regulator [Bacteroides ovatus]
MKRQLLITIICLLGFDQVVAENILFFDSRQLTCDLVTSICQDEDGFIWIGTDYGLNKFNGTQFMHYYNNPEDSTSLLDNSIKTLMLDKEGILWIGSVTGLQYYIPEENAFQHVLFDGATLVHIKELVQLRSGDIWVTSSGKGLYCISKNKKTAVRITDIPQIADNLYYNSIYEDKEGFIWIGVDNVGLLRYNPVTRKSKMYTETDIRKVSMIASMAEDSVGNFFVATATAAYHYDKEQDRFIEIKHDKHWLPIRSILTSKVGTRYLTTYGEGLKIISSDLTELYSELLSFPLFDLNYAKIRAIYEDRNMNLWLGCYHKGVVMVSQEPTPFNFWGVPVQEYPSAGIVTTIAKDRQGNILSGVENGGVFRINSKGKIVEHLFEKKTFSSIYKDSKDNCWFGGRYNGLFMENSDGKVFSLFPQFTNRDIKCIAGDSKDNIYFSVYGAGFVQYHIPTQTLTNYQSSSGGLKNDWINSFLYSSKNDLWIGHCYGIDCFDSQTKVFKSLPAEFRGFITYSLLEDVKGNIWAGTNKGVLCYNPQTEALKNYDVGNGLSNNLVFGLAEDEHGNIWCSTLKGINLVNVDENSIVSYYSERGLVDNEYVPGTSYQAMNGMIYFGGVKGMTYFHPDSIVQQQKQLEVVLSNIYMEGKAVTVKQMSGGRFVIETNVTKASDINLAYVDNTFTLEFSTFDYKNIEAISYKYRIREHTKEWETTRPGINQITYNHLNSGNYTFEVCACKNGRYSPVKVIRIHIAAPWWRSSSACICYILLFIIALWQIFLMIRRHHRKILNEEKIKFFINLSHEIRSPMTLIISPLESLMKRDYDTETMRLLRLIHKNANRIIGLMNQLLDIRKIEKGRLHIHFRETDMVDFTQELLSLFTYQAQKRNIKLHFEHDHEILLAWIDPNNLDKVLVNLLSNAFKYTPDNGEIKICLHKKINKSAAAPLQHYIEIEVIDSGMGINTSELEKIFERFYQTSDNLNESLGFGIGLNLCRMIVRLHHGIIYARNREEGGSSFIIHLPLGKEHLKKSELVEEEVLRQQVVIPGFIMADGGEEVDKAKYHETNNKIIIVDDDNEICDFLESELRQQYKIYICRNGKEGLQAVLKYKPDLVISDVIMPKMDGISMLKELRANPNISHIPVILLTSKVDYKDRIQGLSKGADVYLAKPFNIGELKVCIKNLITMRLLLKGKYSGVREQEGKIEFTENKSSDERLMERVMNVINKYMDNAEFNVEMMAREVGVSRVQLHRKLKNITGVSASIFIRNLRMKKAAVLLKEHKLNVTEVADAVGFDNRANFSAAFKKQYGVTPTEYAELTQNADRNPLVKE